MWKTCLTLLSGIAGATAFFVACSDDAPGNVDAATCDCDPAEPPIAGRLMRVESALETVPPGLNLGVGATCPEGSILLTGSCRQDPVIDLDTFLAASGANPTDFLSWSCTWVNNGVADVTVRAHAVCITPE